MTSEAHRHDLITFFATAERECGLASSWSTLVGIALGGVGGSRDPESRVTFLQIPFNRELLAAFQRGPQ